MMTTQTTFKKRLISICLVLAFVLTLLPLYAFTSSAEASRLKGHRVADPSTMDGWKQFFPISGELTSENAGGVWMDKSVFTDNSALAGMGIDKDRGDSFLAVLSAIASNSTVTGLSHVSTDSMLVLDLSGSMNQSGMADDLVAAANESIDALLKTNKYNRVGVVVYSGSSSSNSNNDAAILLLPLGRYSTALDGKYLSYSRSSVGIDRDLTYENSTRRPASQSKSVTGATYIQKGMALAMDQFIASTNSTTVEDTVVGTLNRKPVVVLMSDGAPTLGATNFTDPGQYNLGDGANTSAALGFVTQLTISYAKAKIEEKYGKDSCLLYTLGLGVSNDSIARSVLNPSAANGSSAIHNLWNSYLSNRLEVGDELTVSSSGYNAKKVTKIKTSLERHYVDQYFSADGNSSQLAEQLQKAFKDIVGAIQLQSGYFPTLIHQNEDLSGYVSFVDRVGQYMEVVDVKGILIHDTLFSGAELASNFGVKADGALGTFEEPTQLALDMIAAICARLGVDTDTAATLVQLAYENGQLRYTDKDNYSNYIGWYANEAGQFLGFYHEGVTVLPEATGNIATDPKFLIKSYGYLGEVDESHGVTESDMMYATVQVREEIESGEQLVTFAVPAALIPTVTYNITLEEDSTLSDLTVSGATSPIRLVYEIGLRSHIHSYNVMEVLSNEYLSDPHNVDADGSVNFYTNQWDHENKTGYGTVNTYSYFNPSRQNDKYYYLEDSYVYSDTEGTLYSGSEHPSGTVYRSYTVYKKNGNDLKTETHYRRLSDAAMKIALKGQNGVWYIPKGNVYVNMDGYTIHKTENLTGTLTEANIPFVDTTDHEINDTGYHFYVGATLGNNGKLTLTPETGIKLTKQMDKDATATTDAFVFTLENLSDADDDTAYPAWMISEHGSEETVTVQFKDGKATVQLHAADTLYIGGMTAGDVFKIEEVETAAYIASATGLSERGTVTVMQNILSHVAFVNADRGTGHLSVYKEISHDFGADYRIPADRSFGMEVSLSGIGTANATFKASHSNGTYTEIKTDANGKFAVSLKHGEEFEVFDLPTGTVATVRETDSGEGFAPTYLDNGVQGDGVVTVVRDSAVAVIVVNEYTPKEVYPVNVEVSGSKILVGRDWNENDAFTFVLQKYAANGSWQQLGNEVTVIKDHTEFSFKGAFTNEAYSEAGVYYYRVIEIEPTDPIGGITYDKTVHSFYIVVGDADMDGSLEITDVRTDRTDRIDVMLTANTWKVDTLFENLYTVSGSATVTVDVNKSVDNRGGATQSLAGFAFGLFDPATGEQVGKTLTTTERGFARFVLTYGAEDAGKTYTYLLKEIVPSSVPDGWTYTDKEYLVTVDVIDTGLGGIIATVYVGDDAPTTLGNTASVAFTNVYDPTNVTLPLDFIKKELLGRTMKAGEFTFEIRNADSGELVLVGTNDENGNVLFDADLTYDKVGTYHYSIAETSRDQNGVKNDKNVYLMAVYVTDAGGELTARYVFANAVGDTVTFRNTYTATPVENTIKGTKILRGRVLINDEFTFTLSELSVNGNTVQNPTRWTAKNFADGTFVFPTITYTQAGIYEYSVEEVRPVGDKAYGITYDTAVYKVTVLVEDDGRGKLHVASERVSLADGTSANALAFINQYVPSPAFAQIVGNKQLVGKVNNTLYGGEFTFELYEADSNWNYSEQTLIESVQNQADGRIEFTGIDYSTDEDKYYVVLEKDGGKVMNGVTYDDSIYYVYMDVVDDHKGHLQANANIYQIVTLDGEAVSIPVDTILFVNRYEITGSESVILSGEKFLEGREFTEEDSFSFALYEADENFIAKGEALQTVEMDALTHKYSISLTYTASDVGNTYYYLLSEVNAGAIMEGVRYSSTVYRIVVAVEDNGVGGIRTVVTTENTSSDALNFVNTYIPNSATVMLDGYKTLLGRELAAGEFRFILYRADETFKVNSTIETEAVYNGEDGSFQFNAIAFDKTGDYYFVIVEDAEVDADRVTFDETVYNVKITVTDDGTGSLVAGTPVIVKSNGESAEEIVFTNVYTPKPEDLSVDVNVNKTVLNIGTDAIGPEGFKFLVQDADNQEGTWNLVTDENGNAKLTFSYTESDIGKVFTYVISEINDGREHVVYSTEEYTVTVEISLDEQTNTLVADYTVNGESVEEMAVAFENVYNYTPTFQTGDDAVVGLITTALSSIALGGLWIFRKRRLF